MKKKHLLTIAFAAVIGTVLDGAALLEVLVLLLLLLSQVLRLWPWFNNPLVKGLTDVIINRITVCS